jgi:hypothetical protein
MMVVLVERVILPIVGSLTYVLALAGVMTNFANEQHILYRNVLFRVNSPTT